MSIPIPYAFQRRDVFHNRRAYGLGIQLLKRDMSCNCNAPKGFRAEHIARAKEKR